MPMRIVVAAIGLVLGGLLWPNAGVVGADPLAAPTLTGEVIASFFQPCPTVPGPEGFMVCATPPQPARVQAQCNPDGTSTLTLDTTGFAVGPYSGTSEEHVTVEVGAQTGPAVAPFFPLPPPFNNIEVGTIGFASGPLTTFQERFRVVTFDGRTTVEGTKTLAASVGNSGVCRQYQNEQPSNDPRLGAPHTAYFYIANAQILSYEVRIQTPDGTFHDEGSAEAYLWNSFGTFTFNPEAVATSNGIFAQSFRSSLTEAQLLLPGKHCGDKNHAGSREAECKEEPK